MSMRDAFFSEVVRQVHNGQDIYVVVADMGAPSLNELREKFPHRFINVGIAEQNAMLIACGLAMEGKTVFVMAITPFITFRCLEQIKSVACYENLPINIVGIGAGLSYAESGITHWGIDDLGLMAALPNMKVINCSSDYMAAQVATMVCTPRTSGVAYIRLERGTVVGKNIPFYEWHAIQNSDLDNLVVTTGSLLYELEPVLDIVDMIEVAQFPIGGRKFIRNFLHTYKKVFVVSEGEVTTDLGAQIRDLFDGPGKLFVRGIEYTPQWYPHRAFSSQAVARKYFGLDAKGVRAWIEQC